MATPLTISRSFPGVFTLPESYIFGTICQAPAGQDRVKSEQPMVHGLWSWRAISAGVTTGPSAQTRDDPGVPREQAFIMRVAQLLGAPLQAGVEGAQRWHIGRIGGIGDRLAAAAITRHHQLHRSDRGDQADDGELGEAVDIRDLRLFDPQTV